MTEPPVIVSACLIGLNTRHDGKSALNEEILKLLAGRPFIPVCPEQLGGLGTPRTAAEIKGGDGKDVMEARARVIDDDGVDVTEQFLKGAEEVVKLARLTGAAEAYLKEKSPSCGVGAIYRKGALVNGRGVTAYALETIGISVKGF